MKRNAASMPLEHAHLPAEQIVEGTPTTAIAPLEQIGGLEVGIWEMTPGTATDVEVDEVFVVLSGRATVTGIESQPVELRPGSVVRLAAGMRTTWTVHETLRKVYVA